MIVLEFSSSNMNMATNYNTSQTYTTPPDSQIHPYGVQQFSPANSTSPTPTNISPTSPRNATLLPYLPLATRQINPPKSPMYVPAVLRPTERPRRPSPLTPPRSLHGSTDSLDGGDRVKAPSQQTIKNGKNKDLEGRSFEDEVVSTEDLGAVTGPPTQEHWKPDADAVVCDNPLCYRTFNLFERRHHCRHCGHIFCNTHSRYLVPLDQDAEFHPEGADSRACKHCWNKYSEWKTSRRERKDDMTSCTTPVPGTPSIGVGKGRVGLGATDPPKSPVTNSVPRDWSWSTF